jgi:hypothetical protein
MIGYALSIFLGAFLLFLLQPLVGKHLLPWFGGSPSVWTTCMLFYQVLLLAGYAYAHLLAGRLRPRAQSIAHGLVVLGALGLLGWQFSAWSAPLLPGSDWAPGAGESPVAGILGLLLTSVGLPFLVLSATSPLVQAWFHRARPDSSPYRLYALSNLGSLLALIGYPFLIEPLLGLSDQATVWGVGFGLYGLCMLGLAIRLPGAGPVGGPASMVTSAAGAGPRPRVGRVAWWLALSACGSCLLLAVTNQISQEVAVVPFLWVLPLTLYLLTFILVFGSDSWYRRPWFATALVLSSLAAIFVIFLEHRSSAVLQLIIFSLVLFFGCMVCHGELARLRPPARELTGFYLAISIGGALGGVFVGLLAPVWFEGHWELHAAIFGSVVLLWLLMALEPASWLNSGRVAWRRAGALCVLIVLGLGLVAHTQMFQSRSLTQSRSFFGVLRVMQRLDRDPLFARYELRHGLIIHGFQLRNPALQMLPTAYYTTSSGVGLALLNHPERVAGRPLRIGVVGLGVGTIAAYGLPNDCLRFYEINPEVIALARGQGGYFDFLARSPADIEVVLGDARLALQRELDSGRQQQFDLLVVDAFSSDAIPVHLLTAEAFGLYLEHLDAGGILALHLTNRQLDLVPVVLRLASQWMLPVVVLHDRRSSPLGQTSLWALITENEEFLGLPGVSENTVWTGSEPVPEVGLWTDDFASLLDALK